MPRSLTPPPPPPADERTVPPVGVGQGSSNGAQNPFRSKKAATQNPFRAAKATASAALSSGSVESASKPRKRKKTRSRNRKPARSAVSVAAPPPTPQADDVPEENDVQLQLSRARLLFLLSEHYKRSLQEVREAFDLPQEDRLFISDLDRLVLSGRLNLDAYLVALEDELKMDSADLKKLQALLLAGRFLPFNDHLKPSATEVAQEHSLELPKTPHYRVYEDPLTYSGAVSEIAETAQLSLLGRQVRNRLRELVVAKLKKSQVDSQILEVMTRGEEFGGLGLNPKRASETLAAMNDILGRAKVLSEDEYSDWLAKKSKKSATPAVKGEGVESKESDVIREELHKKKQEVQTTLGKAVESIVSSLSYRAPSPYLDRRLRNVVSSRLRDVRSATNVREILVRSEKVGGLSLQKNVADKVAGEIETRYQEFHGAIAAEEKARLEEQVRKQKQKVELRRKKEAEEHARWFEEKMRKRSRLQAAPGRKIEMPTAESRPQVDAVSHGKPKLMGLLGELSSVSVDEFRRMGQTPEAATAMIAEDVATLAKESAAERIRGIEAYRSSPLYAEYLKLVGQSFRSGTPVAEFAKQEREKGKNTLTPDEIASIIKLNSALHY